MKILTPATTANLGPGFDCLGLALNLHNETYLEVLDRPGLSIEIEGEGASELPRNEQHLFWKILKQRFQEAGEELRSGLRIRTLNRLPLARGLGSSAAVLVAALAAANRLLGLEDDLVLRGTRFEGHPDNAAPCVMGGLVASAMTDSGVLSRRLPMHDCWMVALAIPAFPLETEKARGELPRNLDYSDAIFNISRASLLVHGLATGDHEVIREATQDRLHHPFRSALIPGFEAVQAAALESGGSGCFLSGAGPTMAALVDRRREQPQRVAESMTAAFEEAGVEARAMVLEVDLQGVQIS